MFCRLTILLLLISAPVLAADIVGKLNIPASEPSEDDIIEPPVVKKSAKQKTPPITAPKAEGKPVNKNMVVLQGLNKVMGRAYKLEVSLGVVTNFENLQIIARKCVKTDDYLENAALLEIRETKTGEEAKQIFLGWMFSSSPSISNMEHPVYDISVISCEAQDNLKNPPPAQK